MPDDLFGIYVHWPYCAKICPYCDFNVYAAKARDTSGLEAALGLDLARHAAVTPGRRVTSLYLGGGTPSLISPAGIEAIIERVRSLWPVDEAVEITMEANPEDVSQGSLEAWRTAGVNRLSLGVQSLDDEALRFLGRAHSRSDALTAIEQSLAVFENVSIDLIYARPDQSRESWLAELREACQTGAPHLSLYELTIKEKTAFQKQVERSVFTPMDDDAQADLYLETLALTAELGLPAYEVSNHARGEAWQSRHNLTYWLGGDWLGVGPGAEGRLTLDGHRVMTHGHDRPAEYEKALASGNTGWATKETLTPEQDADERLIMGLRSRYGADRGRIEALLSQSLNVNALADFKESGHLREADGRIVLTEEGWLLADYIAARLSPEA